MTQKFRRQDLKRNELAETVGKTVDYVTGHRKGVTEAIIAGAAIIALVGGFFLYRSWVERSAGRSLSQALAILGTPLASDQPAPTGKTFASAAERQTQADKLLREAASHGSTASGRAALVILAANGTEKPAPALDAFEKAARQSKSESAAAAEIDAAKALAAEGKTTEAIDRLKRAIESPSTAAPKDALLFTLAGIYEQTGASADARATYQRLITDYPNSPYRADARQKVPLS
ncbi:MAG TPA: tetratricopeptide repeat protein [Thermoanaerobaculia bacterium]|nr:tetratricopeptide repeat protein [Thermoanaerobaculia bacterium]